MLMNFGNNRIYGLFRACFRTSKCTRTLLLRLRRHLSAAADVAIVAVASSFNGHGNGRGNSFWVVSLTWPALTRLSPVMSGGLDEPSWYRLVYVLHFHWLVFGGFLCRRSLRRCGILIGPWAITFWLAMELNNLIGLSTQTWLVM